MRTLTVAAFVSLDGVMQAPGGPEEDSSGGFRLGGWIAPYTDEALSQELQELLWQPFELLLGRRTYEIFAAYWPHIQAGSANHAIAELFNGVPKHVATHRPDTLAWQNSHALAGGLLAGVLAQVRQRPAHLQGRVQHQRGLHAASHAPAHHRP